MLEHAAHTPRRPQLQISHQSVWVTSSSSLEPSVVTDGLSPTHWMEDSYIHRCGIKTAGRRLTPHSSPNELSFTPQ